GGISNTAAGFTSFAAGHRARANHDGAFVWSDYQHADFASTAANQFLVRASGGVGLTNQSAPLPAQNLVLLRVYGGGLPFWQGGAAFGYDTASVILGQLNGVATLGGHNGTLNAWANLALNPAGGNVGIGT